MKLLLSLIPHMQVLATAVRCSRCNYLWLVVIEMHEPRLCWECRYLARQHEQESR